jgi:hypothetical protein
MKKNIQRYPKGYSEAVNRRWTDNTMTKRKRTKGQTMIYKISTRLSNTNPTENRW